MSVTNPIISPTLLSTSHLNEPHTTELRGSHERSHEKLGQEFESLFFSLLIKNMRSSMTEEGLFGSEGSDTYGGLFDLYMGKHLAATNGLGIKQMLQTYFSGIDSNDKPTDARLDSSQQTG